MEFKRCPFCGGEAHLWVTTNEDALQVAVTCEQCGVELFERDDIDNPSEIAIDKAIKKWNERK